MHQFIRRAKKSICLSRLLAKWKKKKDLQLIALFYWEKISD